MSHAHSGSKVESIDNEQIERVFQLQRRHRWSAKNSTAEQRRATLGRLRESVIRHAGDARDALFEDLRKPPELPMMREVSSVIHYIDDAIENLERWMEPTPVSEGSDSVVAQINYEARGVTLLFGPWNFPYQLVLGPLVPILAAGNTAMVKPNEMTPATSAVVAKIIREVFDESEVAVFEGGVELAQSLLELPVDHIFFTGSPKVGKEVMASAAKHLASVTLELGGKCPAVIDASADVAAAVSQIARGKHHNAGQVCLSPDYVWIEKSVRDEFVQCYLDWVRDNVQRDGQLDQTKISKIVDTRNFERLQSYVSDAVSRGARLVGTGVADSAGGFIDPALLLDVPLDADVMRDEIFGPILPVLTYEDPSELIEFIQSGGKPLAMYIFSDDPIFTSALVAATSSGGVTVNGWATHYFDDRLPFGGVGSSGMGSYHGVFGFREMSHFRAIVKHESIAYGRLVTDS